MRTFTLALALAFVLLAGTARDAHAQLALQPYVGFNTEEGAGLLVGIGARLPLPIGGFPLTFQPGIEFVSVDAPEGVDATYLQFDANLLYSFPTGGALVPYAGAGLGVAFASVEAFGDSVSDTELGLNLLGGAVFEGALGFADPYAQVRASLIDGTAISVMGGLIIGLN